MHNYLESRIALYGRRIIRKRGGMENPSVWLKILPSSAQGRERKRKTSRIWSKLFGSTMECGVIESAATLEGRLRRRWFHIRLMTVLIESRIWYLERYSTDKTVIKVDVGKIDTIIPIPQTLMDRIRKICEYIAGYFISILSYTKLKLLESRLLLAKTTLPFFFSTFQQLYSAKIRTVRVQSGEERGNEWHENSDGIRLKEISLKNTIFLRSYSCTRILPLALFDTSIFALSREKEMRYSNLKARLFPFEQTTLWILSRSLSRERF